MTAKEYLNQIKHHDIKIRNITEEIARLEDIANRTTTSIVANKVQTSFDKSKRERAIDSIIDLKEKRTEMIIKSEELRVEVMCKIHKLTNDKYIEILYLRYIEGMLISDIANIMVKPDGSEYNTDHLFRLHGKAIKAFEEIYCTEDQPSE